MLIQSKIEANSQVIHFKSLGVIGIFKNKFVKFRLMEDWKRQDMGKKLFNEQMK